MRTETERLQYNLDTGAFQTEITDDYGVATVSTPDGLGMGGLQSPEAPPWAPLAQRPL